MLRDGLQRFYPQAIQCIEFVGSTIRADSLIAEGVYSQTVKFMVVADSMKSAIKMAWEHGGADFQSRFDKSTGQAQEMKEGALRVL